MSKKVITQESNYIGGFNLKIYNNIPLKIFYENIMNLPFRISLSSVYIMSMWACVCGFILAQAQSGQLDQILHVGKSN